MTTIELEQVIQEYILNIYHKKYIGKLHIQKIKPVGYHIKMELGVSNKPIIICAELEDELFLKFLKLELQQRKFDFLKYGEINLTYPYDCGPRNTSCTCNDERGINRKN